MIKLATVFSGIGAIEQALKQNNTDFEIIFACDNGERYIDEKIDDIEKKLDGYSSSEKEEFVKAIYKSLGKENQVKKSYFSNYHILEDQWHEDIRFIDGSTYRGKVDLLVGGSPCQSFSTYGRKMGLEDTRGTLFYDYARLINEVQPKFFIFENVSGLLSHDKGQTWKAIQQVFIDLNYHISSEILDAQDYGLPQMRRRLFVVGVRNDLTDKKYIFPQKKILKIKVEDLLDKSVDIKYYLPEKGFKYVTELNRNEGRARVNRTIIGCQTANQQFNWTGDFRIEEPKPEHYIEKRIFIGKYNGEDAVARKLTPGECLRLMGFKDFKVVVNDQTMYRQVGNSIAVPVLRAIIEELENQFKELI